MENNYDISVIVPVYNSEPVLAQGLGNLLNQTKQNIQVILINDASTDGSLRIMNDARNAFGERVVVIDQPVNGGPGVARNAGLDAAEGGYIGFMDSDDLIDPTMYEKLYTLAKQNDADIVDCAYFRDSTQKASIHFSKELCGELDSKKRAGLISCGGYNCMKIFRRSMLMENDFRFRPVYALEDTDFLVKAIICAKKVSSTEEILYRYRDTEGSLSKEQQLEKYANVQLEAMRAVYEAACEYEDYEGIRDAVEYMLLSMYKNILYMVVSKAGSDEEAVREEIFNKTKDLKTELIKKRPKNNRFVRSIFNKEDMKILDMADRDGKVFLDLKSN